MGSVPFADDEVRAVLDFGVDAGNVLTKQADEEELGEDEKRTTVMIDDHIGTAMSVKILM